MRSERARAIGASLVVAALAGCVEAHIIDCAELPDEPICLARFDGGRDAGPDPVDAGPVPVDGGPVPVDGGPVPVDAGRGADAGDAGPTECSPGSMGCEGRTPRSCDASGRWGLAAACTGTTPICSAGECVSILAIGEGNPVAHSCVVLTNGRVLCWGANGDGQLGLGSFDGPVLRPTEVPGITGVRQIALGRSHTCARTESGELWCWGANDRAQLGAGTPGVDAHSPERLTAVTGARAIGAGWYHTCAALETGRVQCWGDNATGQTGSSAAGPIVVPYELSLSDAVSVAGGEKHTCARLGDQTVWCWGSYEVGQLGDGRTGTLASISRTPVQVRFGASTPLTGALQLVAGSFHTCARLATRVACWGLNSEGQLATGTRSRSPWAVDSYNGATAGVGAGYRQTCVLAADTVWCAGGNLRGDLGDGSAIVDRTSFGAVADVPGAVMLGTLFHHSIAVLGDGRARCWGHNEQGQCGAGTALFEYRTPVDVEF